MVEARGRHRRDGDANACAATSPRPSGRAPPRFGTRGGRPWYKSRWARGWAMPGRARPVPAVDREAPRPAPLWQRSRTWSDGMTRKGNSRSSNLPRPDAIARAIVEPQTPSSAEWTASACARVQPMLGHRRPFSFSATGRMARRSAGADTALHALGPIDRPRRARRPARRRAPPARGLESARRGGRRRICRKKNVAPLGRLFKVSGLVKCRHAAPELRDQGTGAAAGRCLPRLRRALLVLPPFRGELLVALFSCGCRFPSRGPHAAHGGHCLRYVCGCAAPRSRRILNAQPIRTA